MGRISSESAGTVLRCGSRGPSLEGVWARAVGTEVCKHKLDLGLGQRVWQAQSTDREGSSSVGKKGEWEVVTQAFISEFCVKDGRQCLMGH